MWGKFDWREGRQIRPTRNDPERHHRIGLADNRTAS
jgi:hypothetical protein